MGFESYVKKMTKAGTRANKIKAASVVHEGLECSWEIATSVFGELATPDIAFKILEILAEEHEYLDDCSSQENVRSDKIKLDKALA